MIDAIHALARLREGNRRFASNQDRLPSQPAHRAALVNGQEPFAIILGCSDSRVPAELVFDQGFGDLFVIRVAGNIVSPSQVGSVEFAAAKFGTRLVVVMGHSQCGAVIATLDELQGRATSESENLRSIVDRVRPAVADRAGAAASRFARGVAARSRARERARRRRSPAARLRAARAIHPEQRPHRRRRRVLARDRRRRFLRRRTVKVAAWQAPLAATGSLSILDLIREQIDRCEAMGVDIPVLSGSCARRIGRLRGRSFPVLLRRGKWRTGNDYCATRQ